MCSMATSPLNMLRAVYISSCYMERNRRFSTMLDGNLAPRYAECCEHEIIIYDKNRKFAITLGGNSGIRLVGSY